MVQQLGELLRILPDGIGNAHPTGDAGQSQSGIGGCSDGSAARSGVATEQVQRCAVELIVQGHPTKGAEDGIAVGEGEGEGVVVQGQGEVGPLLLEGDGELLRGTERNDEGKEGILGKEGRGHGELGQGRLGRYFSSAHCWWWRCGSIGRCCWCREGAERRSIANAMGTGTDGWGWTDGRADGQTIDHGSH